MPNAAFDAYCRGNGFGKTIRNYQYRVEEVLPAGMDPYKNSVWGPRYFRMAIEARQHLSKGGKDGSGIHYEHAVPVAMVRKRLIELRTLHHPKPVPLTDIEDALKASEIILITIEQQKKLDGGVLSLGLGLQKEMSDKGSSAKWQWGDCHLARICRITKEIVGNRLIG